MTIEAFPPIMFAGLVLIMLIGFPVAFSLAALGLACAGFAVAMGWFAPVFLVNLPLNVFNILSNDVLLAIPFFTLMGSILEKCGLAEDMLESLGSLFGRARGGLGYAVIIVGFVLGAITGTVAGQIIAMALISLPVMLRNGYHPRYVAGVLAASGTITQLVPPSLVLIVLADQLGRPVGDMYKGAWGPSILQIIIFALYTFALGRLRPADVPAQHGAGLLPWHEVWVKALRGMFPAAALIFAVLGSMGGFPWMDEAICTPTEAGAMGVVGALALAALRRRLSLALVSDAALSTMRITAMVVFILIGARVFSLVFQGVDGAHWIESQLAHLPGGTLGFLLFVNAFVFFLAFFLDFFEIAFIILPMLVPTAQHLGIDMIWFGVMLCVNMQTSFMHPPFGFALFYLRGVADTLQREGRMPAPLASRDIYWGAVPWVLMQLLLVVIVIAFPASVSYFIGHDEAQANAGQSLEAPEHQRAAPRDDTDPFAAPAPGSPQPGQPQP